MRVPYFDLTTQYAGLRDEILGAVDRVCRQAAFVLGEEVVRFEEAFAGYCETRHCVAVNSGTSALHLALLGVGVGPGDEVVTTANTMISTAEAITYTGAVPVFVDIDPRTPTSIPDASSPPSPPARAPSSPCISTVVPPIGLASGMTAAQVEYTARTLAEIVGAR